MTRILLIRHGESEANRNNIFAGQIDPDLQDRGVEQAKLTAAFIKENYDVDRIYASDLKRAYNTALELSLITGIEIVKNEGMREIAAGEWEGLPFDELATLYSEDFNKWMYNTEEAGCTGGETIKELTERVVSALKEIACENDGKTVAVATHATPIRAILTVVKYGTIDKMNDVPWVSNASVTELTYENFEFKVVLTGDDKHLKALVTTLPESL